MNKKVLMKLIEMVAESESDAIIGTQESDHPYVIGKSYLVMTVTHYITGKLERVTDKELVLSTAAWISDTGRLFDALRDGKFNEVEPIIGNNITGRGSICNVLEWNHPLPKDQK